MAKLQCNVISYLLKRTIDLTVILPTVTLPEASHPENGRPCHCYPEPYPVLYLLHGLGNNHQQWCGYTYIAGLSTGGFGALYHGLKNPEKYRAIGAFSAAVNVKERKETDLTLLPITPEACPDVYLTCGKDDFLFENNRNYSLYLTGIGVSHTWVEVPGYGHEWRFWNLAVEQFLDWLPRTDYYAGRRRKI